MPTKRKVHFNPEAAKDCAKKIKAQSCASQQVEEAAEKFLGQLLPQLMDGAFSTTTKESVVELFLVGMLGLKGVFWLNHANRIVPGNFPGRVQVITSMLNYTLPPEKQVSF